MAYCDVIKCPGRPAGGQQSAGQNMEQLVSVFSIHNNKYQELLRPPEYCCPGCGLWEHKRTSRVISWACTNDISGRNVLRHVRYVVTMEARVTNGPDGIIRFY